MWLGRQQPFFRVSPSPCSLGASKCPSSLPFIWPCLHLWVFLTRFSAGDQLLPLGRAASSWRRVLSHRLRESTTTAPLTHLRRSLPGRKLTRHFFPRWQERDGLSGGNGHWDRGTPAACTAAWLWRQYGSWCPSCCYVCSLAIKNLRVDKAQLLTNITLQLQVVWFLISTCNIILFHIIMQQGGWMRSLSVLSLLRENTHTHTHVTRG